MRRPFIAITLAVLSLTSASAQDQARETASEKTAQEEKTTQEKLEGRWEIVAGVNQGQKLSKADVTGTYVTFKTNTIVTYDRNDLARYRAVFTLDEEKNPTQINMRTVTEDAPTVAADASTEEASNELAAAGILRFDSEMKCTLCYTLPGSDRPSKFESRKGSKTMLFTLERK